MRSPRSVRAPLVGTLALALLLLGAADADAQRRRAPTRSPTPARSPSPQVRDANPDVQRLSKGGAHKLITITGSHLERLTGGRIERPNGRALNARVTLPGRRVPPGGLTRRVVRVQATDRTGTGNNLRLVLMTARDRLGRVTEVAVPVRLVVLDAVRIDRARATSELRAGGEAARFVIAGQGLWQLHHPRLERNGRTVPGTSVQFVDRAGRRTTLAIRAGSNVAAGPADLVAGTVDRPMRIGRVEVLPEPVTAVQTIDGAIPDRVEMVHGGEPVTVELTGSYLERLRGGKVHRRNGTVMQLDVRYGSVPSRTLNVGRRSATIATLPDHGPGCCRFVAEAVDPFGGRTEVETPLRVTVYAPVRFDGAAPGEVTLEPGGPEAVASLSGRGFGQISGARVVDASGSPVSDPTAEFRNRVGGGSIELAIRAGSGVRPGTYEVLADNLEDPVPVPVTVEVAAPAAALARLEVPDPIEPGRSTGTVWLDGAASEDVVVGLEASYPLYVPTRLMIRRGAQSAIFPIDVSPLEQGTWSPVDAWVRSSAGESTLQESTRVIAADLRLAGCEVQPRRIVAGERAAFSVHVRNEGAMSYSPSSTTPPRLRIWYLQPVNMERHPAYGTPLDEPIPVGETRTLSFDLYPPFELAEDWSNSNAGRYALRVDGLDQEVRCGVDADEAIEVVNPPPPNLVLQVINAPARAQRRDGSFTVDLALVNTGGWVAVQPAVDLVDAFITTSNGEQVRLGGLKVSMGSLPDRLEAGESAPLQATVTVPRDAPPGILTIGWVPAEPQVPPARDPDIQTVAVELR